jgi:transitional endoplasmic reticulum ATPase
MSTSKNTPAVAEQSNVEAFNQSMYVDNEKIMSEFRRELTNKGLSDAAEWIARKAEQEEAVVSVNYNFYCFAKEGAYALNRVIYDMFGSVDFKKDKNPSGGKPMELIDITLADGTRVKAPWGKLSLPEFDDDSFLQMGYDAEDNTLYVRGEVKRKFQKRVDIIMNQVKEKLRTSSIYKGAAVTLDFADGEYREPEFLDLSNIDKSKVLISRTAQQGLVPIMARIQNTDRCVEENLDLKYGALMEGPYGTGKTLIAFYIAKVAVENGWTFIYLKDCKHMANALKVAANYSKTSKGCVLFTEDIDQAIRGERNKAMQDILNTLDGGDTKGLPIISIFTTNHLEKIEPTFLRGKRIGGLISLRAFDKETAKKFLELTATNSEGCALMSQEADWDAAAEALEGIVPAFAAEILDRARSYMIYDQRDTIGHEDIIHAAEAYKHHVDLAKVKASDPEESKLATALQTILGVAGNKESLTLTGDAKHALNIAGEYLVKQSKNA